MEENGPVTSVFHGYLEKVKNRIGKEKEERRVNIQPSLTTDIALNPFAKLLAPML